MIGVLTFILWWCCVSAVSCVAWASLRAQQKRRGRELRTREELRRQTLAHALRQDVQP